MDELPRYCPDPTTSAPIYLVALNKAFFTAWGATAPKQAAPDYAPRTSIEASKQQILAREDALPLPVLGVDAMPGGMPEVSFVNGIKRMTALREMGYDAVPMHILTRDTQALETLPFIKPLTPDLQSLLAGEEDPLRKKLAALDEDPDIIEAKKRWAMQPEGIKALRKHVMQMGCELIVDDLLAYYQEHGRMPPKHLMDEMMLKAMQKQLAAQKTLPLHVVHKHGHLLQSSVREAALEQSEQETYRGIREARAKVIQPDRELELQAPAPEVPLTRLERIERDRAARPAIEGRTSWRDREPERGGGGHGMGGR